MTSWRLWLCAFLVSFAGIGHADEVLFNNGDRLTGKVLSIADGKLKIKTAVAGEVTVDLSAVKTFSTDEPIELLIDGKSVTTRVAKGPDGTVLAAEGGTTRPVTVKEIGKAAPVVKWTGSIVANGLITRGNSNTEQFGLSIDASRRTEQNRVTLGAGYTYGRQEDPDTNDEKTTTDNWFLLGKYDRFYNKKFYSFVAARVERDRIADLDLRFTPSAGLGYQWVERPDFNFSTEAGVAWVYEEFRDNTTDDHFALRFAYHVDKKLNDKVKLFHNLEYIPSIEHLDDFNINADAGLRADVAKGMFTEFKVEWRHDAEPAPGSGKNDLRYLIGVGWVF